MDVIGCGQEVAGRKRKSLDVDRRFLEVRGRPWMSIGSRWKSVDVIGCGQEVAGCEGTLVEVWASQETSRIPVEDGRQWTCTGRRRWIKVEEHGNGL